MNEVAAQVEVAVARHQVATATDAIGTGLRKAMDETSRSAMGPNLTEPLDAFRSAVDQLAPPAALRQAEIPSAGTLSTAAQRVREAALPLSGAVLGELDTLLADRQDALALQRTYGLTAAAAGVLLGVVLLWWSVPARGRSRGEDIAGLRDEAAPSAGRRVGLSADAGGRRARPARHRGTGARRTRRPGTPEGRGRRCSVGCGSHSGSACS